jgi:hypothetical protein
MVQAAGNVGHPASNFLIRRLAAKPLSTLKIKRVPTLLLLTIFQSAFLMSQAVEVL